MAALAEVEKTVECFVILNSTQRMAADVRTSILEMTSIEVKLHY